MLGRNGMYAEQAHVGNFIGVSWLADIDLTGQLFNDRRGFNDAFIPVYLSKNPEKTRMGAALACGMLYTSAKGILVGDVVLCPDGNRNYFIGEVVGDYEYHKDAPLPHRRSVRWLPKVIARDDMSDALKNATGAIGTISTVTAYAQEIGGLLSDNQQARVIATDESIEDPNAFALEKHLEDYLVHNWKNTELGKLYDIYAEDGESGQQYQSDTGPIDILAIRKDRGEILVIELKKGRASDVVVGQILRYMGWVMDELATKDQKVRGAIRALNDDIKLRRALRSTQGIDFYTYKSSFTLEKK